MTLTLRERQKQALREEIMNAAQELVAEKGYGAMSMDELAGQGWHFQTDALRPFR
jgi:AcrR family transcriptional regulator